jgi:hypothetical protein
MEPERLAQGVSLVARGGGIGSRLETCSTRGRDSDDATPWLQLSRWSRIIIVCLSIGIQSPLYGGYRVVQLPIMRPFASFAGPAPAGLRSKFKFDRALDEAIFGRIPARPHGASASASAIYARSKHACRSAGLHVCKPPSFPPHLPSPAHAPAAAAAAAWSSFRPFVIVVGCLLVGEVELAASWEAI